VDVSPRRIEVEVGLLVIDDPAVATPAEVAGRLERELAQLITESAPIAQGRLAAQVREAVARSLAGEPLR
jgi:hypothetical protein